MDLWANFSVFFYVDINREIKTNAEKLEIITSFKYLTQAQLHLRRVPSLRYSPQTTATLTKLKPVWKDRSISLSPKILLMRSVVTAIFPYACES